MLRLFAHPVTCRCVLLGVVAAVCTPLPTRTHQLPTLLGQQCWEMLRLIKLRTNWRNIVSQQLPTLLDVGRWGPKPSCKRSLEHRALLRMMAREKQNLRVESEEQALGSSLRENRAKRRYFCFALPPTPERGPLETNPHPRARRAGLVPGVARGNGYRSNWTMHNLLLNVLHLHSSETVTCSYLSIM